MDSQKQNQTLQDQNDQQSGQPNPPIISKSAKAETSIKNPSKTTGLFSGFTHLLILLKLTTVLISIVVIFYVGYELALYQTQKGDTLLPHINFTSSDTATSNGSCPAGDTPEYGPLPNTPIKDEKPICLSPGEAPIALKPVIYLYPTQSEQVTVKISYITGLSKSTPTYTQQTGWQVFARPDGQLTSLANGKTYPYLFWEGNPAPLSFNLNSGFVISGNNTSSFLEQQLTSMGLTQNEIAAFESYWLPKMEHNPYNLIHFAGNEYTDVAKLTVVPKPKSVLRIFMVYEPLQQPVKVIPQTFQEFHREGFTVVEWGGTELKNN